MGIVSLKVTESKQVASPTMFSFEEEKKLEEQMNEEFKRPSKRLFELEPSKEKKSTIEKLMGL